MGKIEKLNSHWNQWHQEYSNHVQKAQKSLFRLPLLALIMNTPAPTFWEKLSETSSKPPTIEENHVRNQ